MIFEVGNEVLIYYLPAELDHCAADMLKRKTEHVFEEEKVRYIIFDFSKTSFMDSSGIGLLTGRYRKIRDKGGKVYVIHVSDAIDRVLKMSGIYQIVEKRQTRDEVKQELLAGGYYE